VGCTIGIDSDGDVQVVDLERGFRERPTKGAKAVNPALEFGPRGGVRREPDAFFFASSSVAFFLASSSSAFLFASSSAAPPLKSISPQPRLGACFCVKTLSAFFFAFSSCEERLISSGCLLPASASVAECLVRSSVAFHSDSSYYLKAVVTTTTTTTTTTY
jgi:hypothetical protein